MIARILKLLLYFYKYFLSLFLPKSCRYLPSCSEYAFDSIDKHGAFKGCFLIAKRLLSCHPWGSSGYDPVPEKFFLKNEISRFFAFLKSKLFNL